MDTSAARDRYEAIANAVSDTVIIDENALRELLTGFIADGHVLLEDVPGTGKTLTARTVADALGLSFSRIQFTPDLLPADITGSEIFNEESGEFEFQRGPLFANLVLADEINRASPKTQSALLEAMAEGQVSVGNESYALPEPFFVIATQNPIESAGTFELPAAQLDRFMIKTQLGYPDLDGELELLDRRADRNRRIEPVDRICPPEDVAMIRKATEAVEVSEPVRRYVAELARATRTDDRVATGVSPRGTERLFEATRATAIVRGRDFATPDDAKTIMPAVLGHRISLTADARVDGITERMIIDDIRESVPIPRVVEPGAGR